MMSILTNKDFIDFDFLSLSEKREIQQRLLKNLLNRSQNHIGVSDRLKDFNFSIKNEWIYEELKNIDPIDTYSHLKILESRRSLSAQKSLWKFCDNHIENQASYFDQTSPILFSSGGTTGDPKITMMTMNEVAINTRYHGKGYYGAGIRSDDIVATFGLQGPLTSEFTVYLALNTVGPMIVPIGDISSPANVIKMIEKTKANVLLVMPSDFIPILDYLKKTNKKLDSINKIVTGGESLKPILKNDIIKYCGKDNLHFGSTFQASDVGTIGFQCSHCQEGEYHVHEELQYVECLDGELVVTNLSRFLFPVIRVKTGDRATLLSGHCECGRIGQKVFLKGRKFDLIKIGGEKLDTLLLCDMIMSMHIGIDEFQIKISSDLSGRDILTIKISKNKNSKEIQKQISLQIFEQLPYLKSLVKNTIIGNVQFDFLEKDEIKYGNSGKILHVIDGRQ